MRPGIHLGIARQQQPGALGRNDHIGFVYSWCNFRVPDCVEELVHSTFPWGSVHFGHISLCREAWKRLRKRDVSLSFHSDVFPQNKIRPLKRLGALACSDTYDTSALPDSIVARAAFVIS